MLAPIALFPDALLSQVLMASTYPSDVALAVDWAYAHRPLEGDAAVQAVQDEPWDPSVQSLVAFPQALAMLGEKPRVGAQPGRRLPRPARAGDGLGAAPAREGEGSGQPAVRRAPGRRRRAGAPAAADDRGERAAAAHADHHHRPRQPAGRVRARLPPPLGVRPVVAPGVSPVLLPAAGPLGLGGADVGRLGPRRVLVGPPHPRDPLPVGRGPLGPAQREHQRQPLEHHPRQSPDQLARRQRGLAPQRRAIAGACPTAARRRATSSRRRPAAARDAQRDRARLELANRLGPPGPGGAATGGVDRSRLPQRPVAAVPGTGARGSARDRAAGVDRAQIQNRAATVDRAQVQNRIAAVNRDNALRGAGNAAQTRQQIERGRSSLGRSSSALRARPARRCGGHSHATHSVPRGASGHGAGERAAGLPRAGGRGRRAGRRPLAPRRRQGPRRARSGLSPSRAARPAVRRGPRGLPGRLVAGPSRRE